MSKKSKLCQVVNDSTRLDETRVSILLCGYSGSIEKFAQPKVILNSKKMFIIGRYIAKKRFLTCDFSKFFPS